MKLLFSASFLLALALPVSPQKVRIEYDHEIDLTKLRKYAWKEHPFVKNNPDSKQFSIASGLVQSDVNDILLARGYQPVDDQPEIFITQFVTARIRQDTKSVPAAGMYPNAYMWPGSWYSWSTVWFSSWDTYIENYLEGILLLDVVDAKSSRLIWRAACKDKIDDMKERHKNIEKTVKKALKSYPPEFKPPENKKSQATGWSRN